MVFYEVISTLNTTNIPLLGEIGKIGLWLQALGVVVVLTIIFEAFAFYFNMKRLRQIAEIRHDVRRIEAKINKLLKRNK